MSPCHGGPITVAGDIGRFVQAANATGPVRDAA